MKISLTLSKQMLKKEYTIYYPKLYNNYETSFMEQYQVQLGGLGERCKLPKRGLGRSPSGNQI